MRKKKVEESGLLRTQLLRIEGSYRKKSKCVWMQLLQSAVQALGKGRGLNWYKRGIKFNPPTGHIIYLFLKILHTQIKSHTYAESCSHFAVRTGRDYRGSKPKLPLRWWHFYWIAVKGITHSKAFFPRQHSCKSKGINILSSLSRIKLCITWLGLLILHRITCSAGQDRISGAWQEKN